MATDEAGKGMLEFLERAEERKPWQERHSARQAEIKPSTIQVSWVLVI